MSFLDFAENTFDFVTCCHKRTGIPYTIPHWKKCRVGIPCSPPHSKERKKLKPSTKDTVKIRKWKHDLCKKKTGLSSQECADWVKDQAQTPHTSEKFYTGHRGMHPNPIEGVI